MVTATLQDTLDLIKDLPVSQQQTLTEVIKTFIRAYDPDFTKLTETERIEYEHAKHQFETGEVYEDSEIDWSEIGID